MIPLDDRGSWFRYHHLFADVLRDRLAQVVSADDARLLHLRAAEWLENHGLVEDAVQHATAGQDWERVVRLLERVGGALYEGDRIPLLRSWLEGLPSEALDRSPRLTFWLAWALARSGDPSRSMTLLQNAEASWTADGDRQNLGLVKTFYAFHHLVSGDSLRAIEEAQDALDRLPDYRHGERSMAQVLLGLALSSVGAAGDAERAFADARLASGGSASPWVQSVEMVNTGAVLVQQGKLVDATVLFRRVIKTGHHLRLLAVQNALVQLGHVYIEMNMLDEAERTLRHADELVEKTKAISYGNRVCLGLARLAWARGQIEEAFDEVERALGYAHQSGLIQFAWEARAWQAHLWLASGQIALARRWADGCGLDPDLPPEYERWREHLTIVRLLILEGRPDLALKMLTTIQGLAEATGRHGEVVEMSVLRALAHRAGGDNPSASKRWTGRLPWVSPAATSGSSSKRSTAWPRSCVTRPSAAPTARTRSACSPKSTEVVARRGRIQPGRSGLLASEKSRYCGWWRTGCSTGRWVSASLSPRRRSRRT